MILHDQHVHSSYSVDSNASLKEYYEAACKAGCSFFITTEHIDYDSSYHKCDWDVDYPKLKEELSSFKGLAKPLLGVEIGYRIDLLPRINKLLKEETFDLVNLSIHDSGVIEYYYKEFYEEHGPKQIMRMYYEQMLEAVTNFDNFDVLSHIDYGYKAAWKYDPNYKFESDEDIIKEILSTIIKKHKVLEINTKVQSGLDDNHLKYLLNLYKSLGGTELSLSSDAHEVVRYRADFDKYMTIIKSCGFNNLTYFVNRNKHLYNL